MAAAAEGPAGSGGGGSPSSARRRLRIISGHLRGSPRAPEREALSPSPCKAQGGSAGPASGSIPKKRWVRAGVPAGQQAPGCAAGDPCRAGRAPGAAGCRSGSALGQAALRRAASLLPGDGRGLTGPGGGPAGSGGVSGSGTCGEGSGGEEEAKPNRGSSAEAICRCRDWMKPKEGGLQPRTCVCSKWDCVKMESRS